MAWLRVLNRSEGRIALAVLLVLSAFALKAVQADWARDVFMLSVGLLARELGVNDGPGHSRTSDRD